LVLTLFSYWIIIFLWLSVKLNVLFFFIYLFKKYLQIIIIVINIFYNFSIPIQINIVFFFIFNSFFLFFSTSILNLFDNCPSWWIYKIDCFSSRIVSKFTYWCSNRCDKMFHFFIISNNTNESNMLFCNNFRCIRGVSIQKFKNDHEEMTILSIYFVFVQKSSSYPGYVFRNNIDPFANQQRIVVYRFSLIICCTFIFPILLLF